MNRTLWRGFLCGALALCLWPLGVFAATEETEAPGRALARQSIIKEAHKWITADHSVHPILKQQFARPEDVTKALRGAQVDTLYGKATVRAADNQMVIPNYVARVKVADGVLRPVIEQTYPATITPAASPLCKM